MPSYTDEKTIITTLSKKKKWKQQHPNFNQSDKLHKLNRPEHVVLFRLRTGHNRLNDHVYNKFKVGESEMCPCNADIMTSKHLLQHCPLHDALRRDMWPEPVPLRDNLYGNLKELRRTAAFVRATGISVKRTTTKKKCARTVGEPISLGPDPPRQLFTHFLLLITRPTSKGQNSKQIKIFASNYVLLLLPS